MNQWLIISVVTAGHYNYQQAMTARYVSIITDQCSSHLLFPLFNNFHTVSLVYPHFSYLSFYYHFPTINLNYTRSLNPHNLRYHIHCGRHIRVLTANMRSYITLFQEVHWVYAFRVYYLSSAIIACILVSFEPMLHLSLLELTIVYRFKK